MATTLFLLDTTADTHLATNNGTLQGGAGGWVAKALGTSRGSGLVASTATATAAGPVTGIEVPGATEWISPPVSADVTISGTITANVWAAESNMSANVAINVIIEIIRANALGTNNSNTLVEIVRSTRTTEVAVTTRAVNNFTTGMTSGAYTSQTLNRGDRLRIRVFGDDAGTMASGFTFNIGYNGNTGGADGDTFVTFTENFSFESAPAGTQIFLTNVASDVTTASIDKEAWTSRGSGVASAVTLLPAGWTAPVQVTDTHISGTVIDWFTKQLNAFTLTGMAVANLRALEANALANVSVRCEIARVDDDGTNPTVWASWCIAPTASDNGELTTSEVARTANVSGDDLVVSDGQRLRIRLYMDDISSLPMAVDWNATVFYNGTTASASGDTYVTLAQTVTEFTASAGLPGWIATRMQRF